MWMGLFARFILFPNKTIECRFVLETINETNLSYCASFGLEGFHYLAKKQMRILVLNYDAEHG